MFLRLRYFLVFSTLTPFMILLLPLHAIPIDNSVMGDPKVECTGEQVGISFTTEKSFTGRIYVQGYASQKDCVMSGTERPPGINLSFSQCGVQRSRQLNPPGMIMYTTVVISFHPIFVTKIDRAYRIACHYMEASKTVTADMDVSMLTTAAVSSAPAMPECRYEILTGGATGAPAKYARVGEQIYHKWTCDSKDNAYCMRVHSCSLDDGQGSESFMVVNRQGCATDRFVLQNLEYLTDLMAGQETHVVKFADKSNLYFSCQIELLSKASESANCASVRPNCTEPPSGVTTLTSKTLAPAPAAISTRGEVRRRVARQENIYTKSESKIETAEEAAKNNFQIVGDVDLLRQQLTVFDLDDNQDDPSFSSGASVRPSPSSSYRSQTDFPSIHHDRYAPSKTFDTMGIFGPICISPLGFGFALFGLLTIFVIALSTAIRYALPSNRLKYDGRKILAAEFNVHNLPRHLSYTNH